MRNGIAWAVFGGLWIAGALPRLRRKYHRSRHHHTHRVLGLTGRAELGGEIDPQVYSDAMLRAALSCLGYLLALLLGVFVLWLVSNLVVAHHARFILNRQMLAISTPGSP